MSHVETVAKDTAAAIVQALGGQAEDAAAQLPDPLAAQDRPHAFVGARIIPIEGEPIERGVLVVHRGAIVTVGPDGTAVPDDAVRHDVAGKVIMPGLVDTHSHIGGGDGGDRSAPLHPSVRILDTIDARDDGIQRAQAGGVTVAPDDDGRPCLRPGESVSVALGWELPTDTPQTVQGDSVRFDLAFQAERCEGGGD